MPAPLDIRWLTAFVDLAPEEHLEGLAFWQAVTGCEVSPARGEQREFVSLVPPAGDAHLRVQRLDGGPSRVHLDVHVSDLDAAVTAAERLGAVVEARPGHAVMRSPGGFPFCLVTQPASRRPEAVTWTDVGGGSHGSRVDQLSIDIPRAAYDREIGFWSELTGWPLRRSSSSSEYARFAVPTRLPLRLLTQALEEEDGPVRAHLDVGTPARAAELARLAALGAQEAYVGSVWTALRPPVGPPLCVAERDRV